MSVLVVGLSHRTAPVALLEKVSVAADDLAKTLDELHRAETISEVLLLSTCNRIEVYADVARFHPAVAEISTVLARHAGVPVADLAEHLYVHFAEAAAEHMFTVDVRARLDGRRRVADPRPGALGLRAGHRGRLARLRAARTDPDRAARRQAGALRHRHRPGRRVDRVGRARPRRVGAAARSTAPAC